MKVLVDTADAVTTITINRPEVKNAFDPETSALLCDAFRAFAAEDTAKVAILTGVDGNFCTGADMKAALRGDIAAMNETGDSPVGPVRMRLKKPVIAAISGYAVAGGTAIASWCDLRVAEETAVFGMFDRRWGVPIVGALTAKLPRLIGLSNAMDIILTGREVSAADAYRMGLVNRLVGEGEALAAATELAHELCSYPWQAMVNDRLALLEGMDMTEDAAMRNEFRLGLRVMASGETADGMAAFVARDRA